MFLNSTINLRALTPHIMLFYTHKMNDRIVWFYDRVTSLHPVHIQVQSLENFVQFQFIVYHTQNTDH